MEGKKKRNNSYKRKKRKTRTRKNRKRRKRNRRGKTMMGKMRNTNKSGGKR